MVSPTCRPAGLVPFSLPHARLLNAYTVGLFPAHLRSAAPKQGSLSPFCH